MKNLDVIAINEKIHYLNIPAPESEDFFSYGFRFSIKMFNEEEKEYIENLVEKGTPVDIVFSFSSNNKESLKTTAFLFLVKDGDADILFIKYQRPLERTGSL